MTIEPASSARFQVLIAGGGVASFEAALALRDLAGDRVALTLIAPNSDFVYRPMTVREPFSFRIAGRYPVGELARDVGGQLIEDAVTAVDPAARTVTTSSSGSHRYDALLLGLGAQIEPRYEHAITIDDQRIDEQLHGLVQDVEEGYVKHVAFVIPPRIAWPLPVYELAMMTATRAYEANVELTITILTPEDAPLAVFGDGASDAVAALLAEKRIEVMTSVYCEVPAPGQIEVNPGGRTLSADRIVALPELAGPALPGLPAAEHGFIPVDENCMIRGLSREFAAGDAVEFPVKHGGLASQQADAAAEVIAALAGAPVQPEPFHPVIHGMLLTGEKPRYLSAHITGGHGFTSQVTEEPPSPTAAKITAHYLGPYIETRDREAGRVRGS